MTTHYTKARETLPKHLKDAGVNLLRMNATITNALLIAVCALIVGCTSPPQKVTMRNFNSVIDAKVFGIPYAKMTTKGDVGTLSTEADLRSVIVFNPSSTNTTHFIAEPSPDVMTEFFRQFALLADAALKTKGDVAELNTSLNLIDNLSRTMVQLTRRSQGVVLFRDGSYRLTEAYLNKAISEEDYVKLMTKLLETAKELIMQEVPLMSTSTATDVASPVPPVNPTQPK